MLSAWILFPLVMLAVAAGLGALLERAAGRRLPAAVLLASGLAAAIVLLDVLTRTPLHAAAPAIAAALAVPGLVLIAVRRRIDASLVALALTVFAVYAVPIVASGEPTFAGYVSLDDTATWLAIGDGRIEEGDEIDRLPPSSYEATLGYTVERGYPAGAMLPFAAGARLAGVDPAWAFQPYLALLAALLALLAELLLRGAIPRTGPRLAAAFLVAQPALLFAFAFWSGVKEMTAAVLVAGSVAAVVAIPRPPTRRALLPAAAIAIALLSALSLGGAIWLLPGVAVLIAAAGSQRRRVMLGLAGGAGLAALISVALSGGRLIPRGAFNLVDSDVLGNLAGALSPFQLAGVWPAGDFRFDPDVPLLTIALIATAILLWLLGGRVAIRNAAAAGPVAAWGAGASLIALVIALAGSPWLAAKSLAIASPAFLALAFAGAASLRFSRLRIAAGVAAVALGAGIIGSNLLAYGEVRLAPYERLTELERLGEEYAGRGPLLLTDFEPYGTRHLLRDTAPEGPAELRRSRIPLRDGSFAVAADGPIDVSRLRAPDLAGYPLILQRVSPLLDPPPAPWAPVERGRFYELYAAPPEELLGSAAEASARRPQPSAETISLPAPTKIGRGETAIAPFDLPASGDWQVWVGVDSATPLDLEIKSLTTEAAVRAGRPRPPRVLLETEPSAAHEGQLLYAGTRRLPAGRTWVEITNAGSAAAPGGAVEAVLGRVVLRAGS